jgi:hypothetical protein
MAWKQITDADVLEEVSPPEAAMMKAAAGDKAAVFVARAIAEVRGAILGGGYPVGDAGTLPEGLHSDALALARWRWLIAFPALAKLQTKERKDAFEAAQRRLQAIQDREYGPESPVAGSNPTTGQWNAENKLNMRTHPTPRPSSQAGSSSADDYANPSGPSDS